MYGNDRQDIKLSLGLLTGYNNVVCFVLFFPLCTGLGRQPLDIATSFKQWQSDLVILQTLGPIEIILSVHVYLSCLLRK